jgi:two-component system nitrate/nitrite response regulator NarL
MAPVKLLIVDDHPLFRDGLAALLRQSDPETIVVPASSTEEALRIVDEQILDAVFMDLMMPGLSGEAVINAGACGYIPKSATAQTVVSALRLVLSGNLYIPPLLLSASRLSEAGSSGPDLLSRLTERQVDVLRHLRDGLTNKEISAHLGIAEKTVKVHIAAIFKTLNVVNRTQAAKFLHDAQDATSGAR